VSRASGRSRSRSGGRRCSPRPARPGRQGSLPSPHLSPLEAWTAESRTATPQIPEACFERFQLRCHFCIESPAPEGLAATLNFSEDEVTTLGAQRRTIQGPPRWYPLALPLHYKATSKHGPLYGFGHTRMMSSRAIIFASGDGLKAGHECRDRGGLAFSFGRPYPPAAGA
jgi:hypothetical protein